MTTQKVMPRQALTDVAGEVTDMCGGYEDHAVVVAGTDSFLTFTDTEFAEHFRPYADLEALLAAAASACAALRMEQQVGGPVPFDPDILDRALAPFRDG